MKKRETLMKMGRKRGRLEDEGIGGKMEGCGREIVNERERE